MFRSLLACFAILFVLVACKDPAPPERTGIASTTTVSPPPPEPLPHLFTADITEQDISELVKTLTSDRLEGRGPGSRGETETINYIRSIMQQVGLNPGNSDSYYQTVPIIQTTTLPDSEIVVALDDQPLAFESSQDIVVGTRTARTDIEINDSEMIFVGYGVDAPEQDWNDYADQDWTGKTVVILINDPGFHANDKSLFDGEHMTYYGRWTYKFEEAARKGAAAALIIHDDAGAGYEWDVVHNTWSGPQYDLPVDKDSEPRLKVQGWMTTDAAHHLFDASGLKIRDLYAAANKRGFEPIPLRTRFSAQVKSSIQEKTSHNVIGVLPGNGRADEAIVYVAHWDHLGTRQNEAGETAIYPGAVDNATGIAGMLEIAGAFAQQAPGPSRSVVFLASTLEESGLLGTRYYVQHPTFPLKKIVGAINIDSVLPIGQSKDMIAIGLGQSEMDTLLESVVNAQGRVLRAEPTPQIGLFFRSDHFNFAKVGIPTLYATNGIDLINGGTAAGQRALQDYSLNRYHKPEDKFDPLSWRFDGLIQNFEALYEVGRLLAGSGRWPAWKEDSEFRTAQQRLHPPAVASVEATEAVEAVDPEATIETEASE